MRGIKHSVKQLSLFSATSLLFKQITELSYMFIINIKILRKKKMNSELPTTAAGVFLRDGTTGSFTETEEFDELIVGCLLFRRHTSVDSDSLGHCLLQ
jgi:hypothetical protein